jgi:hypothetical protein
MVTLIPILNTEIDSVNVPRSISIIPNKLETTNI